MGGERLFDVATQIGVIPSAICGKRRTERRNRDVAGPLHQRDLGGRLEHAAAEE